MFDFVGDMIHSSFLSTFTGDHSHDAAFHVGDHHHQATNFYTFSGNGKAKLSTSFKSATAGQDINDIPSKKKANSTKEAPAEDEKSSTESKEAGGADDNKHNSSKNADGGGLVAKAAAKLASPKDETESDK
eukprot:GEMP01062568.1.p1 GENE.GEMP01062568.1~~GEMP01062568.1.p1  ORF type:complete len:131 (+),score=36.13 GEMP01062568.1:226-618(+)